MECAARFERDRDAAAAYHAEIDTPTPVAIPDTFTAKLLPFQHVGVEWLLSRKRTLLADEMGLGKTVTALAALAAARAFPALIVVPPTLVRQWDRMAAMFLRLPDAGLFGADLCEVLSGLTPRESFTPTRPLTIIHYGVIRGWYETLQHVPWKALVFDEVQELRHTGTLKYTAASVLADGAPFVWGLSGTPIHNYGSEIWSVLNIVEYHCLGDSDFFSREWCTGYGSPTVADTSGLGQHLRNEGLMLRRTKADVMPDLPAKRRAVVPIDKDDNVYAKMIARAVALAQSYGPQLDWAARGQLLREMDTESRVAAGVAKAPFVAAFVETLIEAGEVPLVYAWHHAVHDAIGAALVKYNPVRVTGRETLPQRDAAVRAFIDAEGKHAPRLMQLSLRTTAGLDGLQSRATCVVFAELDWSPAVHSQCEDRIHRKGMTAESLLCYYLVCDAGSDEVMQDALGLKVAQFAGIMGDANADDPLAQAATESAMQRLVETLAGRGSV